jgi:hypothetical protein
MLWQMGRQGGSRRCWGGVINIGRRSRRVDWGDLLSLRVEEGVL